MPLSEEELASLTDIEHDRMRRIEAFMREEFGYIAIQSTRPQTIAYGLIDSPVGQLAWIMDKFREWTYPRQVSAGSDHRPGSPADQRNDLLADRHGGFGRVRWLCAA